MIIKVIYNSLSQNYATEIAASFSDKNNKVELYNEDFYKDQKKAILIKASCGTRITPFIAVYNDSKELVKAFYGEDSSNKLENLKKWMKG